MLQIRPYDPIRPRDPVLQIPPLNRNGFSSILETAETTQMPTIFHGPYQSGKTSLLYSMSDDLSSRGYHVCFVDLDDAIQLENFTVEGFYQELSVQVLRIRMGEGEFRAHIEDTYASKKTAFFLIDEMQCAIQSSNVERAVRGFCRFLDKNGIPWGPGLALEHLDGHEEEESAQRHLLKKKAHLLVLEKF